MRLRAARVNDADIVGYSVCIWGPSIRSFQSHIKGELLPPQFYRDIDCSGAVWLYMSVTRGERILEIRLRETRRNVYERSTPGLMVSLCTH